MKIAIGADHRGFELLPKIVMELQSLGCQVQEQAMSADRTCDYPDMAYPVARAVSRGEAERGVLLCGTGIGMCITANKVTGVRAAVVYDEISADMSRRHNDANVLCLPADLLGPRVIEKIVNIWVTTEFEGGRHARRVEKINAIENGGDPQSVSGDIDNASA